MVKNALLLLILVLAAYHLNLGMTAAERRGSSRFPGTITVEASLAVAVLLVVGRLIGLESGREVVANRTPPELLVPLAFTTNDGLREARLMISPGAAGISSFTIEVDGELLPAETEGVLQFEPVYRRIRGQELGLPATGQNRFQAAGSELTLPGNRRIGATMRALGRFSWATETIVPIDEIPPPVPVENPAPRFAPAGILGMIAVAAGVVGLVAATAYSGALLARRGNLAAGGTVSLVSGTIVSAGSRILCQNLHPRSSHSRRRRQLRLLIVLLTTTT